MSEKRVEQDVLCATTFSNSNSNLDFFFKAIAKRRNRNKTVPISRADGAMTDYEKEIKAEAVWFFHHS